MLRFFKRKKTDSGDIQATYEFLGTDVHAHLLPGVDDGAADLEAGIGLISALQVQGFTKLITTPHISLDFYPNTRDNLLRQMDTFQAALMERQVNIEIKLAAEYMLDDGLLKLLAGTEPLLGFGDNYLLFEMGFVQEDPRLSQIVFEIQARGYIPVLAHPERYPYYYEAGGTDRLFQLRQQGCHFQLNTIALSGYYGKPAAHFAAAWLQAGLYTFAGSDVHHRRHLQALGSVLSSNQLSLLQSANLMNPTL